MKPRISHTQIIREKLQKRRADARLESILTKLHKKPLISHGASVKYAPADVLAANKILQRLLANSSHDEVSSIRDIPEEIDEL